MIKKLLLLLVFTASSVLLGMEAVNWRLEAARGDRPVRTALEQEQIKQLWLACKSGKEAEVSQLLAAGVDPKTLLYQNDPLALKSVCILQIYSLFKTTITSKRMILQQTTY